MNWDQDFKENVGYRFDESTRMIEIALGKVTESHIWQRPNEASNSIGNQIVHLCGNMTQYVIASLGEQDDNRDRDIEFAMTEGFSKEQLLQQLQNTIRQVKETIDKATEDQLLKKRNVQGFNFSGMGCVIHALEHYSYHTGQIAFWVKQIINKPLGFYDGMDLSITNDE